MVSAGVALLAAVAVLAGSIGWIMRDRAARQAELNDNFYAAVEESQRLQKEGKWPQAQAAAVRAEALLRDGAADPAGAERVRGLLRKLAEEQLDVGFFASLEAIRGREAEVRDDHFVGHSRKFFEQAFIAYGLHRDAMAPEEAARALSRREPGVRGTVLAALDHWLILANSEKAPEAAWLKRVLALADSDPWRQSLRRRASKMTATRWRSWRRG